MRRLNVDAMSRAPTVKGTFTQCLRKWRGRKVRALLRVPCPRGKGEPSSSSPVFSQESSVVTPPGRLLFYGTGNRRLRYYPLTCHVSCRIRYIEFNGRSRIHTRSRDGSLSIRIVLCLRLSFRNASYGRRSKRPRIHDSPFQEYRED